LNKLQSFQEFLSTQTPNIEVLPFILDLLLAALLSYILAQVYMRHGTALSNRMRFSRNFLPITMTTMLIITVVKSSLALSLGLVGALSVIRFRTAIKEPEELSYLFLSIAIGLGLGASQRMITIVGFGVIGAVMMLTGMVRTGKQSENLHLTILSESPNGFELKDVTAALLKHSSGVNLRRFDESQDMLEASYLVEFDGYEQMEKARAAIRDLGEGISVSFVDNRGLS